MALSVFSLTGCLAKRRLNGLEWVPSEKTENLFLNIEVVGHSSGYSYDMESQGRL